MSQTIVLRLPDDIAQRYQRGAEVAQKKLDEFVVERLKDAAPLLAEDAPLPLREEMEALENLDDQGLWKVTRARLNHSKQRRYSQLLLKNSEGTIGQEELQEMRLLGEEARLMTLRKAHAFMLLRWRGHKVSLPDEPQAGK